MPREIQRLFSQDGLRQDLSARSVEVAKHFSVTKYADTSGGVIPGNFVHPQPQEIGNNSPVFSILQ